MKKSVKNITNHLVCDAAMLAVIIACVIRVFGNDNIFSDKFGDVPENDALLSETMNVNINTADFEELRSLPFIDEADAWAIINYREENGLFTSADELLNICGISEQLLDEIRDMITL